MTDPRLAQTVFVGRQAVHQPLGSPAAPPNAAIREAAAAWQSFVTVAEDTRNSTAGPLAQGQAIARAAGPAAAATAKAAKEIAQAYTSVKARAEAPAITPWSKGTAGYWDVATGLELAKHLRAMTPGERAQTLAEIRENPQENSDWLAALVNAPRALSGLSREEVAGLHVTARRAADPEAFAALQTEAAQVTEAAAAVARMVDIGAAAGAPRADVLALPEVAALLALPPLALADEHPAPPQSAVQLRPAA